MSLLLFSLLVACSCFSSAASPSAIGFAARADFLAELSEPVSARIEQKIAATHPPPVSPHSGVQFENFNLNVTMDSFRFQPGSAGWQYVAQDISFKYHVKKDFISESGHIYIFTTNENHKYLVVDADVSFAGPTPKLTVNNSTYAIEQGDLFIVGQCSDTICVIPVSTIIDPIAAAYFPSLQKAIETETQTEGQALLDKVSDFIKVNVSSSTDLVFDLEGALTTLADGSLAYTASGATLVDRQGNGTTSAPVTNSHPLPAPEAWATRGDVTVALGEYFLSCLQWGLATSGELSFVVRKGAGPITLSTDNAFFLAALPGLANHSGLNLTLGFSPTTQWPSSIVNTSGLFLGPSSWQMTINIVNGTTIVLPNAAVLNVSLALELELAAAAEAGNKVQLQFSIASHSASVSTVSSKVGSVDTNAFDVLIKFAFLLAKIPPVAFQLPADLQLQSVNVDLASGYALIILDATPSVAANVERMPFRHHSMRQERISRRASIRATMGTIGMSRAASQLCHAGESSCDVSATCCPGTNTSVYACCPSPHATCCSQQGYCCPTGYGCDDSSNPPQCAKF